MSLRSVRILLLVLIALEGALLVFGPQAKDHLPAIQAALAAKEKPDWDDDASMGIRYAAWINLVLLLVLLGTAQWWAKPFSKAKAFAAREPATPGGSSKDANGGLAVVPLWGIKGLFWPLLLVAIVTCIAVRLPLASKSLWWDESWVVLQVSHGKWRPDAKKPGQLKFVEHDWKRCAFYYQKPTNHVPMSLAQKASFTISRALTHTKPGEFSDLAARMPALIASAAAVLLLALLLRRWGFEGAGIVAAFLLALHPWYIRYGVDARAYALVVPLCIAGMFAVTRIFQTRGYNVLPWVAWGAIEFVWLWAYPNAAVDVTVLNLLLAYGVQRYNDMPWQTLVRLAVTNVFAAMAFIQMFLPNFMQATRWAGNETVSQPLTQALFNSTLSQVLLGVELAWPPTVEAAGLVSSTPGIGMASFDGAIWLLLALLVILPFARHRFAPKGSNGPWWVLSNLFFSTSLFMLIVRSTGSYFYPRFIIAALPCLIAIVCLLVAEAVRKSEPKGLPAWLPHLRRWVAVLLALGLAIQVFPFWKAQIEVLGSRPYAPLRDVATYVDTQPAQRKDGQQFLVVCYGHGHETLPVYLPTVASAVSKSELEKYMTQARAEKRGLLVIQGHTGHNRSLIPDGFQLLDDSKLFREIKAFAGIDPEFYYRVYEME
ncbi:hypothetical protein DES53_114145 [Roseimicrobium gellanilyticum]|uniref:Glycosyltransferase RgtA/B/C/D-like domain-containing protein n=1 Tax=Roseimicrobium gellanilyticum TaxID=748857 RepID=A0A366H5R6_9BACT|nr:hypothetical protein [Roseimicrobium gellanilyticum]RBP37407.1 hypothetical protein DES53_114145 [Roseimicrobium gellanilyticum]